MPGNRKKSPNGKMTRIILEAMADKKAKDPVMLNFENMNGAVCDAFVICHGTSRTHTEAIAEGVIAETKKKTGTPPWHTEGFENAEWILIDYIDIVVHIFQESKRTFYNLEQLWADAKITRFRPKE